MNVAFYDMIRLNVSITLFFFYFGEGERVAYGEVIVAAAQEPYDYLYTIRLAQATGRRNFLDIVIRYGDCVFSLYIIENICEIILYNSKIANFE